MEKLGDEFGNSLLTGDLPDPVEIEMTSIKQADRQAENTFNGVTDVVNKLPLNGKARRYLRHYMLQLAKSSAQFENPDSNLAKAIENIQANHIE